MNELIESLNQAKGKGKKVLAAKLHLSLLRELSRHTARGNGAFNPIVASILLATAQEAPDADVERKIIRTCLYLISESLMHLAVPLTVVSPAFASDFFAFLYDDANKNVGTRQCLMLRSLGSLARTCGQEGKITQVMLKAIKKLVYPVKQKKMLMGQKKADKEYESALLFWSANMSGMRRLQMRLPRDCLENAFSAAASQYDPLARHGMALIVQTAVPLPFSFSSTTASVLCNEQSKAADGAVIQGQLALAEALLNKLTKGGSDAFNFKDHLCCSYVFRSISMLASNINIPIGIIVDLYFAVCASANLLHTSSPKICADVTRSFFDNSRSWEIKSQLLNRKFDILFVLSKSLVAHLDGLTERDIALPVIIRSCLRVGRFLIKRPFVDDLNGMRSAQDASSVVPIWLSLENKYTYLCESLVTVPASASKQNKETGVGEGFQAPLRTLTRAMANPHLFCNLLNAMIWVIPDER